jgi:hypothetical protein
MADVDFVHHFMAAEEETISVTLLIFVFTRHWMGRG